MKRLSPAGTSTSTQRPRPTLDREHRQTVRARFLEDRFWGQVLERLTRNLQRLGRLRTAITTRHALNLLLVLTSYETFRELREAGLSDRQATRLMQETARQLLVTTPA